jgi:hypothetical protein
VALPVRSGAGQSAEVGRRSRSVLRRGHRDHARDHPSNGQQHT